MDDEWIFQVFKKKKFFFKFAEISFETTIWMPRIRMPITLDSKNFIWELLGEMHLPSVAVSFSHQCWAFIRAEIGHTISKYTLHIAIMFWCIFHWYCLLMLMGNFLLFLKISLQHIFIREIIVGNKIYMMFDEI